MATEILRPNAAGDSTEWNAFPNTGEANWEDVDDESPDGDATYLWGGVACGYPPTFYMAVKENGVITSSEKLLTTTYAEYSQQWDARPSDGQNFVANDIANLQIGIRVVGDNDDLLDLFNLPMSIPSGSTINYIKVYINAKNKYYAVSDLYYAYCTQVYVEVDYTAVDNEVVSSDAGYCGEVLEG